ncbi:MAG: DUF975 family protein, partial [Clostridia bacterium]|nr:DUF975 family protein [Clostridia bacterium]
TSIETVLEDIPANISTAMSEMPDTLLTSLKTALGETPSAVWGVLGAFIGIVVLIGLVIGIAYFILGSFVQVGYAKFNLNAVDGAAMSLDNLFSYISQWKRTALASFLQSLYIFLWSCLLVVPGIVASYSYAMTKYILAEDDTISPNEAITRSKELMRGNRWRLFCLEFSFIGWALLTTFTFGVGNLWLTPYTHAAEAAFYRHITGTEVVVDAEPIIF